METRGAEPAFRRTRSRAGFVPEQVGFNPEIAIQFDIWHNMSIISGLNMSNTRGSVAILRQRIDLDVFDYQVLLDALGGYRKPRDKITRLIASGEIVRVKKGLYCFGEAFRRSPICREYLANLIYGPSYVSLDYALSLHGLIPERVKAVTSVTTRRSRSFETPLGHFSYRTLSRRRYAVGVIHEVSGVTPFLVASPEKALVDKIWSDSRFKGECISDFEAYLLDDLRIGPDALRMLDRERIDRVQHAYASPKIRNLVKCLERMEDHPNE